MQRVNYVDSERITGMKEPWEAANATTNIHRMAQKPCFGFQWKTHAKGRMAERNIIMSDILYVLKNGFVYEKPIPATRDGYYKYAIECKTPNSERSIRLIVIPNLETCKIKIITVMWADEN